MADLDTLLIEGTSPDQDDLRDYFKSKNIYVAGTINQLKAFSDSDGLHTLFFVADDLGNQTTEGAIYERDDTYTGTGGEPDVVIGNSGEKYLLRLRSDPLAGLVEQILSGEGVPDNSLGKNNDHYVDKDTFTWSEKISGGWVQYFNLLDFMLNPAKSVGVGWAQTIAPDLQQGRQLNFAITLAGDTTLELPINPPEEQSQPIQLNIKIEVTQDATGFHDLLYANGWKSHEDTLPAVHGGPNKTTVFSCFMDSNNNWVILKVAEYSS